jgi:hypothetical protein
LAFSGVKYSAIHLNFIIPNTARAHKNIAIPIPIQSRLNDTNQAKFTTSKKAVGFEATATAKKKADKIK